jgi:hypothetical protein
MWSGHLVCGSLGGYYLTRRHPRTWSHETMWEMITVCDHTQHDRWWRVWWWPTWPRVDILGCTGWAGVEGSIIWRVHRCSSWDSWLSHLQSTSNKLDWAYVGSCWKQLFIVHLPLFICFYLVVNSVSLWTMLFMCMWTILISLNVTYIIDSYSNWSRLFKMKKGGYKWPTWTKMGRKLGSLPMQNGPEEWTLAQFLSMGWLKWIETETFFVQNRSGRWKCPNMFTWRSRAGWFHLHRSWASVDLPCFLSKSIY